MKLKRLISYSLAVGLLFNYVLTSFAGVLSEDGRYETFEGNNITIDNILEEDKVDIEIEGNTLVNLADIKSTFEIRNMNSWYEDFSVCETSKLKLNTDYTLFIYKELLDNHNENYNHFEIGLGNTLNFMEGHPKLDVNNSDYSNYSIDFINHSGNEVLKTKIKFNDFKEFQYLTVRPIRRYDKPITNEYANLNIKIVLLEGDYTKENIDYFEGMKSVGQNDINGHKIEIISSNKNLFDGVNDRIIDVYSMTRHTYENGVLRVYNVIETNYNRCSYSLSLKPNTWYVFSCNYNINLGNYATVTLRNGTYEDIELSTDNDEEISFKFLTNNSGEIDILFYSTIEIEEIGDVSYYNIQLEESNIATDYTPYKSNIKEILLKEPLRSLPNGVKDRIVKRNGQWVIERNCGEVELNGSESWFIEYGNNGIKFFSEHTGLNNKHFHKVLADSVLSDKLINNNLYYAMTESEYIEYSITTDLLGSNEWRVSTTQNMTLNEFKQWLSINKPKVIYELETPIYEPLNIDSTINLYLNTTHVSNNSTIPANMKVTIDRTINRAVEAIDLAKTNPTVENLSKARMWINLLDETIKKDELHNEINNITNIDGLQIEKKNITANMDLYIKSQNSLSMSLSTNSIIFDEFSGVEDMEKLNAVNITINSSLPYQLNSYLESEIKNSDGSKIIPKELLNIRLNGENDYKAFSNINEKLVLKENCLKGNDNQFNIDLILKGSLTHKADIYKTVIKFEAEQK